MTSSLPTAAKARKLAEAATSWTAVKAVALQAKAGKTRDTMGAGVATEQQL